jgi:hypothetical protein
MKEWQVAVLVSAIYGQAALPKELCLTVSVILGIVAVAIIIIDWKWK